MRVPHASFTLLITLALCTQSAWAGSPSAPKKATKPQLTKTTVTPKHFSFEGILLGDTLNSVKEKYQDKLSNVPNRVHKWITHGKYLGESTPYIFEFSNSDLLQEITLSFGFDDYQRTAKFFETCTRAISEKYGPPTQRIREFDGGYEDGDGKEEAAIDEGMASIENAWEHKDGETLTIWITPEHEIMVTFYKSGLH